MMKSLLAVCLLFVFFPHSKNAFSQQLEQAKPWLGIGIEKGEKGVLINKVMKDTPAESAGLMQNDEVLSVGGVKVSTPEEIISAVQSFGVGQTVEVRFLRDRKELSKKITLVARPDTLKLLESFLMDKPAPDFDLAEYGKDKTVKLSSLKGKVVLLQFWATWCPACKATHKDLSEFAKTKSSKGVEVLAITAESTLEIKPYIDKIKPVFRVLIDTDQKVNQKYLVPAIPTLVVVDPEGIVRYAGVGGGMYLVQAFDTVSKCLEKVKEK